jgi:hypothetical protein
MCFNNYHAMGTFLLSAPLVHQVIATTLFTARRLTHPMNNPTALSPSFPLPVTTHVTQPFSPAQSQPSPTVTLPVSDQFSANVALGIQSPMSPPPMGYEPSLIRGNGWKHRFDFATVPLGKAVSNPLTSGFLKGVGAMVLAIVGYKASHFGAEKLLQSMTTSGKKAAQSEAERYVEGLKNQAQTSVNWFEVAGTAFKYASYLIPITGITVGLDEYGKAKRANNVYTPWLNTLGPNATVGDANRAMEKGQG